MREVLIRNIRTYLIDQFQTIACSRESGYLAVEVFSLYAYLLSSQCRSLEILHIVATKNLQANLLSL